MSPCVMSGHVRCNVYFFLQIDLFGGTKEAPGGFESPGHGHQVKKPGAGKKKYCVGKQVGMCL